MQGEYKYLVFISSSCGSLKKRYVKRNFNA
jgi:hypothetical protein